MARTSAVIKKIKRFIESPAFLLVIAGLFLLQATWFAVSVRHEIPPDETYHFQLIEYYADRPVTAGPVITSQVDNFALGDLERTPSYLYHYVLSFPMKVIEHFFGGMMQQLILLRLINVLFGVTTLYVIYRIYLLLTPSKLVANIGLALMAMTGSFIWLSAAVNYDNLAILLFLGAVYFGLSFAQERSVRYLLAAVIAALATMLVKITFAPVLLAFTGIILFITLRSKDKKSWLKAIKRETKISRTVVIALSLVCLALFGLFAERVGRNLVEYKALTPACTAIHSVEQCRENGVYLRNTTQAKTFQQFKDSGQHLQYSPLGFAGGWLDKMYESLFFYFSRDNIKPSDNVANLTAVFGLLLVILLVLYKQNLPGLSPAQKIIAFLAVFYIATLYIFNLNSYLHTGAMFGFQGRYLLPVMPFVYFFVVLLGVYLVRAMYRKKHILTLLVVGVMAVLVIFHHLPFLTFYRGATQAWYTDRSRGANSAVHTVLDKTRLAKKGSLEYQGPLK